MLTKSQKAWIQAHTAAKAPLVQRASKDPTFGDWFVAIPKGFLCQACAGWTGPCICSSCSLSIPVVVNGKKA